MSVEYGPYAISPDAFEDNDSFAAAAELDSGEQNHAGLTIHASNDTDYFRWTASADGTREVGISFLHATGDLGPVSVRLGGDSGGRVDVFDGRRADFGSGASQPELLYQGRRS